MSSSDEESEHIEDQSSLLKSNPAWADAISKVLRQKKTKKAIVLSKAKKVADIKPKKKEKVVDFEIVGEKSDENDDSDEEKDEKKPVIGRKSIIKEYQLKGRVKPSILDKDRERLLIKVSTKGVVQLFNAVRQQQKTVDKTLKKAGRSQRKREKILHTMDKRKVLDALSGSVKSVKVEEEKSEEDHSNWAVLNDNFMMGTKLKDWDKDDENL